MWSAFGGGKLAGWRQSLQPPIVARTFDNLTKYPFKPYGFPVVSDPVELLYSREWGEYHTHLSLGTSRRLITYINFAIVFHP